jgi:hypothetical protein
LVLIFDSINDINFDLHYTKTEQRNQNIDRMNELSGFRLELDQLKEQTELQIQAAAGENQRNIINSLMH